MTGVDSPLTAAPVHLGKAMGTVMALDLSKLGTGSGLEWREARVRLSPQESHQVSFGDLGPEVDRGRWFATLKLG